MVAKKKKRIVHDTEFKRKALETLRQHQSEGHTIREIAVHLGVSPSVLYRWQQDPLLQPKPPTNGESSRSKPSQRKAPNYSEIETLKRQNAFLQREINTLKDALMVFARESSEV